MKNIRVYQYLLLFNSIILSTSSALNMNAVKAHQMVTAQEKYQKIREQKKNDDNYRKSIEDASHWTSQQAKNHLPGYLIVYPGGENLTKEDISMVISQVVERVRIDLYNIYGEKFTDLEHEYILAILKQNCIACSQNIRSLYKKM